MTQTRKQSAVETTVNTGIGFVGSWCLVFITFHLIRDLALASTVSTVACTVWSLVRGYAVRRWFATRRAQ